MFSSEFSIYRCIDRFPNGHKQMNQRVFLEGCRVQADAIL